MKFFRRKDPYARPKVERYYRNVVSEMAGYPPGLFVAQYFDAKNEAWVNGSGPLEYEEALARMIELREQKR